MLALYDWSERDYSDEVFLIPFQYRLSLAVKDFNLSVGISHERSLKVFPQEVINNPEGESQRL